MHERRGERLLGREGAKGLGIIDQGDSFEDEGQVNMMHDDDIQMIR